MDALKGPGEGLALRVLLINSSFNRIPIDENKGAESILTATVALLRRCFLPR